MINYIDLCEYLISINSEIIERTAIKNSSCIGLNSFIINEKPKIRLFTADSNCELYKYYDYKNPIIPIHPHKYDDLFITLQGNVIHHIYELGGDIEFNSYQYGRLSDNELKINKVGKANLSYLGTRSSNQMKLDAKTLHSVQLKGDKCSWMIIETFQDSNFKQIAYHKNLRERKNLYQSFENPVSYLKSYLLK